MLQSGFVYGDAWFALWSHQLLPDKILKLIILLFI